MQSLPCLYFHKDPPNMNISSSCLFCGKIKSVIRLFLLVFSCSPRESEVTCDTLDDIGCQRQLYLYVKREFSLMLPSKCVSSNCYARGDFSKQELEQSSEYLSTHQPGSWHTSHLEDHRFFWARQSTKSVLSSV